MDVTLHRNNHEPNEDLMNQYPANWKEIAKAVKDKAGWKCIRCKAPHVPFRRCLTVHHLDMDKANCEWWNLVALCQVCHLHVQAKVDIWQVFMFEHSDWLQPYIDGRRKALGDVPCT